MAAFLPKSVLLEIEKWNKEKNYGDISLHFYNGKVVQMTIRQTLKCNTIEANSDDFMASADLVFVKEV